MDWLIHDDSMDDARTGRLSIMLAAAGHDHLDDGDCDAPMYFSAQLILDMRCAILSTHALVDAFSRWRLSGDWTHYQRSVPIIVPVPQLHSSSVNSPMFLISTRTHALARMHA